MFGPPVPRRRRSRVARTRHRRLGRLIALIVGSVFAYLPVLLLVSTVSGSETACKSWEKRPLVVDAVNLSDLVEARRNVVVVEVPRLMALSPHDGVSLPGLIALSDRYMTSSSRDRLLWHELAHQHQYRRDGTLRFLVTYLVDWHRGLLAGCGTSRAYEAIGYEREAHEMIRAFTESLDDPHASVKVALLLRDPATRPG